MKYLNELTKRKIFNYNDLVLMLGDNNLAKNTLQNYLKKGYIKRIKHNLYGVVSLETNECIANKFLTFVTIFPIGVKWFVTPVFNVEFP